MNNLIDERDKRTERRKKFKKKVDSMFNLSFKDDKEIHLSTSVQKLSANKIRLLDEGAIVGDDYIDFIIKKGTLEKFLKGENQYLDNLTDDFVGTVNLGHMDFATFPFIIGEYTAKDLSLVDIGDERHGIDVDLRLDSESVFVKELQRQPYDIGVSSEFYYHVDWESTDSVGYLVIDEVFIFAYGLVGECGNVNSSGLELKGENMADKEKLTIDDVETIELSDEEPTEETIELDATAEEVEEKIELSEEAEEETEEVIEEDENLDEDASESDTDGEEDEVEEVEEDEEDEVDEADGLDEVAEAVETLSARIAELETENVELKAQCESLKKTNRRLNKKLNGEIEKKEKFCETVKNISIKLGVNEKKEKSNNVADARFATGDGIGD